MTAAARVPAIAPGRRAPRFPRYPLFAAIGLVLFAAGAIVFGQTTGIGTVRVALGTPQAIRDIVLTRHDDDTVVVADARSGATVAVFPAGEGGFVRGALRPLARMRLAAGAAADKPYRLIRWDSGAISLSDTATGERIYLDAFGADNAAAFAQFLDSPGRIAR
ncbi:photosynthetic complex assembly protein PuhC [Aquibium sp. A9E412]|uniref:photosynthetic complex assembly protein PuhC n=1 Tax=Aquibium sp. A9E412 TaxID=2976767 RepID=UPI0025B27F1F|nr:photosynthetic complex assembly protein PuhC [Aquibium sp. A9E412]MDN2566057.1 photosynthetic complex assembly protein PuhC [Aquibium sp. A9E412]